MKYIFPKTWLLAAIISGGLIWTVFTQQKEQALPQQSPEQQLNYTVTTGAAAGYIEDKTCGTCHAELYKSYQHVGMAKSFIRPAVEHFIENFDASPYFHLASQRYYQITRQGDELIFNRYQLNQKNQAINVFQRKVDYILGSGNKSRSYLYQTEAGELFQLPISWYSEEHQWGMAPGYDNKNHAGVLRPVLRECMFCHNAFPNVPKNSDLHWQTHTFPKDLPQGTGCQRCHGPGNAHVQTVKQGTNSIEEIRASITNPARLTPEKRDAVCFQCHLLPSVSLIGIREFSRADYSFRPGEEISDYLIHIDIDDAITKREDRFEINHHAYRLRQSKCFIESEGTLSCISCHNPHQKVTQNERLSHYGSVCKSCHKSDHKPIISAENKTNINDCIACHMPQRRTQDVVHVTMTDHKIQNNLSKKNLLAPLKEVEPILEEISFLIPEKSPKADLAEIYKAVILLRARTTANYVDYLEKMLIKTQLEDIQPYFDLTKGQLLLKRFMAAEKTSRFLLNKLPDNFRAKQWLATALLGQGQVDKAEELFRQLLIQKPASAEIHFNYALLLTSKKQHNEALINFKKAINGRPNMVAAWFYCGELLFKLHRTEEAIKHYQRALEIDPSYTRAYLGLAKAFEKKGAQQEARLFLKHGTKMARQPKAIIKALGSLDN